MSPFGRSWGEPFLGIATETTRGTYPPEGSAFREIGRAAPFVLEAARQRELDALHARIQEWAMAAALAHAEALEELCQVAYELTPPEYRWRLQIVTSSELGAWPAVACQIDRWNVAPLGIAP